MADIAVHASSPAIPTAGASSAVTAQFSPPANTLLVACVWANEGNSGTTITVSNSGTPRTWTQRARRDETDAGSQAGLAAIFTAPNATALTNTTVTASTNRSAGINVKVYVLTDASLTTPVGATGEGSSATNNITPNAYTSTAAASFGIAVANEWNDNGLPTSTDVESASYDGTLALTGMGIVKAAVTPTAGTTVTFNMDAAGTGAAAWNWAAVEILKGATDATVTPSSADVVPNFPAASVSAGSTASPAVVQPAVDFPAASLSAGSNIGAAVLSLAPQFPTPSVTTDDAEIISAATVTVLPSFPAAALSAGSSASPGAVTVGVDFPAPVVTAQFNATIAADTLDLAALFSAPSVVVPLLPGEFITDDGQVEFGGTLWGAGTAFRVQEISGWETPADLDDQSALRPNRHGAIPGRRLAKQRIVNIDLLIDADPDQIDQKIRDLRYATRILGNDAEWSLVIRAYGEPLLAYGSVRDRPIVLGGNYNVGKPTVGLVIGCTDPRRYSLTQQSVVVPVGASPQTLTNGGDVYTSPRIRIAGPCMNPTLTNLTLERVLAFDITLGASDVLTIDTQLGEVLVGAVDHMGDLSDSASVPVEDFVLDPGGNQITFETGSGGTAGAEFLYRDSFL